MQRKKSRQDSLFLYSGVICIYNVGLRGRKPENQENNCCRRQEHTINYSWLQAGIKQGSRWRETSAVTTGPSLLQEFQSTHFSHNTNETKSILIPLRYDVMADGLHVSTCHSFITIKFVQSSTNSFHMQSSQTMLFGAVERF